MITITCDKCEKILKKGGVFRLNVYFKDPRKTYFGTYNKNKEPSGMPIIVTHNRQLCRPCFEALRKKLLKII